MSEEIQERYLYTVYPKKPIKNLNENLPLVRVPRSLYLTKEEVAKCFECGSVYRRFSNEGIIEKFHKYEIDRVHRDKYISVADWKKIQEAGGKVENLKVNGIESQPTNGDPSIIVSENADEDLNEEKVGEPIKEEMVETTSGYLSTEEDSVPNIEDTVTITNNDTIVEVEYNDLVKQPSEEISEEINDTTEKVEDIIESEEDTDIEAEDSEELEDDSEENAEEVSNIDNTTTNKTVVNYGKKKKHHH